MHLTGTHGRCAGAQALPFWSRASLLHLSLVVCVRNAAALSRGAFATTGLVGSRVVQQAPMPGLDLEVGQQVFYSQYNVECSYAPLSAPCFILQFQCSVHLLQSRLSSVNTPFSTQRLRRTKRLCCNSSACMMRVPWLAICTLQVGILLLAVPWLSIDDARLARKMRPEVLAYDVQKTFQDYHKRVRVIKI